MSLVLALCGCSAAAPAADTGIFMVETIDSEEGVMQITGISPGTAYLTIASEELGTRVVGVKVE